MTRITRLDDLMFPVREHSISVTVLRNGEEHHLPIPGKKALLNETNQRVLGIVGQEYELVTNAQALKMALTCCRTVFPQTSPHEWQVNLADAPSTAGHCHMDLVHNSAVLDFQGVAAHDRPEIFGPFIRVTNSYNAMRALGFDIGFFRKVCQNGMIVPESIIRLKFNHQRRDLNGPVQFDVAHSKLAKFQADFTQSLNSLRACDVKRTQFEPLLCAALHLDPMKSAAVRPSDTEAWQRVRAHIDLLNSRYANELGENAYAVFNSITDFASRPPENRCIHRTRNGFQKLAGTWLSHFRSECNEPGFSVQGHIDQLSAENDLVVA